MTTHTTRSTLTQKQQRAADIYAILCELFPIPETELAYTHDYEFLFAVIMSAQTTDKQVNVLTSKLFKQYPTLESFADADIDTLIVDMASIGLYKAKARNIKAAANLLITQFNSRVPQTMEELITIPGAGRKTANVVMHHLFNKPQGIAVDTHVKRLSQQLGLTKHDDVVKIEQDLLKLIPQPEWGNFSIRLILYGRRYSPARPIATKPTKTPKKQTDSETTDTAQETEPLAAFKIQPKNKLHSKKAKSPIKKSKSIK